jgi:hypothetical protein
MSSRQARKNPEYDFILRKLMDLADYAREQAASAPRSKRKEIRADAFEEVVDYLLNLKDLVHGYETQRPAEDQAEPGSL